MSGHWKVCRTCHQLHDNRSACPPRPECPKCRHVHDKRLPCPPQMVMILDPATDSIAGLDEEDEQAKGERQ